VLGEKQFQGGLAGLDGLHLVAFGFEVEAQALGQVLFVFDNEDAVGAAHLPMLI
jgi:hypothetical protein